jgi:hypothetical protein
MGIAHIYINSMCTAQVYQMARVLCRKLARDKKKSKQNKRAKSTQLGHHERTTRKHNKNCKINMWNPDNMQTAIEEYHSSNGTISVRTLARAWNVPRSTLQMRIAGKVSGNVHASGRKPVFNAAAEADLVNVIQEAKQKLRWSTLCLFNQMYFNSRLDSRVLIKHAFYLTKKKIMTDSYKFFSIYVQYHIG